MDTYSSPRVAIVGATGAVGTTMLSILEERGFPLSDLRLLASARSAGSVVDTKWGSIVVEDLAAAEPSDVDIALFSAGGSRSLEFAPLFASAGATVIDNSSAFRMDATVPLVVAEVNDDAIRTNEGIVANPNCTTMVLMMAAGPLHEAAGLRTLFATSIRRLRPRPVQGGWASPGRGGIGPQRRQRHSPIRRRRRTPTPRDRAPTRECRAPPMRSCRANREDCSGSQASKQIKSPGKVGRLHRSLAACWREWTGPPMGLAAGLLPWIIDAMALSLVGWGAMGDGLSSQPPVQAMRPMLPSLTSNLGARLCMEPESADPESEASAEAPSRSPLDAPACDSPRSGWRLGEMRCGSADRSGAPFGTSTARRSVRLPGSLSVPSEPAYEPLQFCFHSREPTPRPGYGRRIDRPPKTVS